MISPTVSSLEVKDFVWDWTAADCMQDVNWKTLKPSASCTLAGSSVFVCFFFLSFFSFFFFFGMEALWFLLSHGYKKNSQCHSCDVYKAGTDTSFYPLEQKKKKSECLFNINSTVQTLRWNLRSFYVFKSVYFHCKDHTYSNIYYFLQKLYSSNVV